MPSFEDLYTESILDNPDPEVATSSNHVIVEVVIALVGIAQWREWLLHSQREEAARPLMEIEGEVLAPRDRQIFLREMFRPKPFLGQSLDVLSLSGGVDNRRVQSVYFNNGLALHG